MSLKKVNWLWIGAGAISLSACGSYDVRDALGVKNAAPDEYSVVANNPLSVPPDFELRPPRPGSPRPNQNSSSASAKKLLLGTPEDAEPDVGQQPPNLTPDGEAKPAPVEAHAVSNAEQSFKEHLKLKEADPNVKQALVEDSLPPLETDTNTSKKKPGFWARFFRTDKEDKPQPVVDATKEKERIEKNKVEGKPVNEGNVVNKNQKEPSTLEKIFGE
ncbi:MAG: DUF3035 domain-containing protein [Alphaproteobacteria bacterium]|nr:DUF3035 domain-containing protein [Alphaproteobacteria bacterium]